ncbi:protein-disulfide reductase DsbD N-terminal domain-containing protein [Bradyrhizobium sp. 139]|nr:protein-disulfide reductase DsbD N-terminal domain-containing protein [Bradyrhizobium sp. 139]
MKLECDPMSYGKAFALVLAASPIAMGAGAAFLPRQPDEAFVMSVQRDEEEVGLELTWTIAPGYYLYRDKISATLDGRMVRLATPKGQFEGFGPYRVSGMREVYRSIAMADTVGEQLPQRGC